MARARVAAAALRRRRQVQHAVGEAGEPAEAGPVVEVAGERHGTGGAPAGMLARVAQQGEDAETPDEAGQRPPGNITATDDQ